MTEEQSKEARNFKVGTRWGSARLGNQFCPVSSYFLRNYHRLNLNSSDAMLVIQLMDHKWDERHPFPSLKTIAQRMGLAQRTVRHTVKTLQGLGLLKRLPTTGGTNRYDMSGLFAKLEELMDADANTNDKEAA